jgi:hypothetical protein
VLRSKTPAMVEQEVWAHLLVHYAIRKLGLRLTRKSHGRGAGGSEFHPVIVRGLRGLAGMGQAASGSTMTALPLRITILWPVRAWSWAARLRALRCLLIRAS